MLKLLTVIFLISIINLIDQFNIVVSNPPFHNKNSSKSNNKFTEVAKRIFDLEKWMESLSQATKRQGNSFLSLFQLIF